LVEEDYYALNTYGDQALQMPLDTLEWATEDEHWNPEKKKLSEKTREELKRTLTKWRVDVKAKRSEFYDALATLATRDLDSGKLTPVDPAKIDTRQVRYHEKSYIARGNQNYVFDIVPRDSEELVHKWTSMLQAKINLESDLRRFFRELD
jgi:hypothetical protein